MKKFGHILGWLERRSKASLVAGGLCLVLLVGVIDFFTPAEMSFGILFLIPIMFATWLVGSRAGVLFAVVSTTAWAVVDLMQHTPKEPLFIPWWDATCRLGMFLVVVFLLNAIKVVNRELESRIEKRTEDLRAEITGHHRLESLLRQNEEFFRQLTEAIQQVFWMTNLDKSQMIYVSPGYERIWGRTCDSLYASPKSWVEAIHPEDRDIVLKAATTKQVDGEYNYEYRVVHPNGSIRWVHDRAFPVQDALGKAYRIAGIAQDITDRKQTENALREIQRQQRALLDNIPDIAWLKDKEGFYIAVNNAHIKASGVSHREYVGKTAFDIWPRELAERYVASDKLVMESRQVKRFEEPLVDVAGNYTWLETIKTPIFNDQGEIIGTVGIGRDITERKLAEVKLATLAHAVEGTSELICITDIEDRFVFVNQAFQRVHGYTEAEILGKTPEILYSPRNPPTLHAEVLKQTRLGGWRGEVLDRRKDGTEFPVYLSTSLVKDRTGRIIGLLGVAQDITERKRAEEAMRLQSTALEAAANGIVITDREGDIVWVNPAFTKLTGYELSEVIGKNPRVLKSGQHDEAFYQNMWHTVLSGRVWRGEIVNKRKDGSLYTEELIITPVRDAVGEIGHFIAIQQDITERKRASQALQKSEQQYRTLVETTNTGFVILDQAGRVLDANAEYVRLTGHMVLDEIRGRSVVEWTADSEKERNVEAIRTCLKKGYVRNLEIEYVDSHVKVTPIEVNATVEKTGGMLRVISLCRDITERKLAEARMATLAHAVQSTAEMICITDLQDRFTFVNRAFMQAYGYTENEVLGKTPDMLFSPKNPPTLVREVLEQTRSGGWRGEVLDRRKDGGEFPISLSTSQIRDESGRVIGLMGVARDIGERKKSEEALRESEERFRTAFGGAPVAMAIVDLGSRFLQANEAFCRMMGYSQREALAKTVLEITHPDDIDRTSRYFQKLLSGSRTTDVMDKRYIHKLGHVVWGRTTASLVCDKSGHPLHFIAHIQDFTERRRLEREILEISDREQGRIGQDLHDGLCQQLVSAAFAANRLGQTLAMIAPSEAGAAKEVAGWLDEAISQARSLARGLYPVKLEAGGLASALQELAEYVNERFGITCVLEDAQGVLLTDNAVATHLYRIAQEAVTNAVKHSKASRIQIKLTNEGGNISVCVKDDGVGIPDVITSGMGLHIMQYRTRMIGGTLKVARGSNGGTAVVCSFHQETTHGEGSDGA